MESPPIDALCGRSPGGLAGQKLRFRPQLFWQEVLPEQAASADLEFHCDMATGRNFAKVPSEKSIASDGGYALSVAKAVEDGDGVSSPPAPNTSSPTDLGIDPLLTGNVTEGVDKRRRRQPKANTEQTDAAVSSGGRNNPRRSDVYRGPVDPSGYPENHASQTRKLRNITEGRRMPNSGPGTATNTWPLARCRPKHPIEAGRGVACMSALSMPQVAIANGNNGA